MVFTCTELQWLLSPAAPAKTRLHGTYCSEDMDSHKRFRPCSSPLSTFMLSTAVSFFLHGSIVSTTFLDIQIIEMGSAPTVSKSEMKPRSINSATRNDKFQKHFPRAPEISLTNAKLKEINVFTGNISLKFN